jgi:hypothetical protein
MTLPALAPPPTLSRNPSFSGHETFAFRHAWLKKGVDGICERPDVFLRDEAMVELGVGKNMVRSIRHWCLATRVAEEGEVLPGGGRARGLALTDLGRALFVEPGWDPFLEDDASLWLIHWNLATNPDRATTWYWGFNRLHEQQFSREAFLSELQRMAEGAGGRGAAVSSLKADVSCFLRTYVAIKRGPTSTLEETLDCPLTTLNLITEVEGDRAYRFNNGPKPGLPPAVFCYALLDCWNERHGEQQTLSLREIVHGEGSPGRVFRLDEDATLAYLDGLDGLTNNRLVFNDTALVRQVVRRAAVTGSEILGAYYDSRS